MSGGFEDLGLLPELVRATQDQHWILPSDVQDESIPLILGGGDVMVVRALALSAPRPHGSRSAPLLRALTAPSLSSRALARRAPQAAETGSGKTGAFALPAIQLVHEAKRAELEERERAAAAAPAAGADAAAAPAGGAAAAAAKAPPTQLNVNDRNAMVTLSPERLMAQCRHPKDWGGVRASKGLLRGRAYYEVVMRDEGLCRVGWASAAASLDLGTDRAGYGFGGTGKRSNDRKFEPYGAEFKMGDVIGCYLELTPAGGSIAWSKNGVHLGEAFALAKQHGALHPAVCMKNAELEVNFGGAPFRFPPAGGFEGLDAVAAEGVASAASAAGGEAAAGGGGAGGAGGKRPRAAPYCIILAPARDLAEQTAKAVEQLARYVTAPAASQALLIGGMNSKFIRDQLAAGGDITIATPGMLMHAIDNKEIALHRVRILILDEADRFAGEKENLEMITKLHKLIRAALDAAATGDTTSGRLQVCFFSATLHSPEITALADLICQHPTWVDLKGKDSVPENVHHVVVHVDPRADRAWAGPQGKGVPTDGVHAKEGGAGGADAEASQGIKLLKPRMLVSLIDSLGMAQAIIFCRTNVDCDNLENFLIAVGGGQKWRPGQEKGKENPYSCCVLAGGRTQDERRRNLDAFRDGDVRFLICTDVGARGIDIKELPYVINMTLPDEPENYIHRIGRVGRADKVGLAVSLVAAGAKERVWFHKCSSKGKACSDAKHCSVWYDEPGLLGAVQRRLGLPASAPLPAMGVARDATAPSGKKVPYLLTLPPEIERLGAVYGEELHGGGAAAGASATTAQHVAAIRTAVDNLASMEVKAQSLHLLLKARFGAGGAGAAAAPV
jgi:ATP-dependent RNA helicase DDX1